MCKGLEAGALLTHALGPLPLASAHAPDTHAYSREYSGMHKRLPVRGAATQAQARSQTLSARTIHTRIHTLTHTHARTHEHTALMQQGILSLRPQCPLVASPGMVAGPQLVTLWSPGHCQDLFCPLPVLPAPSSSAAAREPYKTGLAKNALMLIREPPQGSPSPSHSQPQLSSLNLPLQRLFP